MDAYNLFSSSLDTGSIASSSPIPPDYSLSPTLSPPSSPSPPLLCHRRQRAQTLGQYTQIEAHTTINSTALLNLLQEAENEIERLEQVELVEQQDKEEEEEDLTGPIWSWTQANNCFMDLTNFTEDQVLDFYCSSKKWILYHRQHGPKPKVPYPDAWVAILAFYKHNTDYCQLAHTLKIKETTFYQTINCMCQIVYDTLCEHWWEKR